MRKAEKKLDENSRQSSQTTSKSYENLVQTFSGKKNVVKVRKKLLFSARYFNEIPSRFS